MRLTARLLLAGAAPALLLPAPVAAAQDVQVEWLSERLAHVTVDSAALEAESAFRVLVPAGFAQRSDRYPVLYLLHGGGDEPGEIAWTERTDLEAATEDLDLLIVMPRGGGSVADFSDPAGFLDEEGNNAGWYSDWFNGGGFGPPRWAAHHLTEVMPLVEQRFRGRGTRETRAILGLSMGGFGALSYAARHPDLFSFAASFSGAVDTNLFGFEGAGDVLVTNPFVSRFGAPRQDIWGPYTSEELRWRTHNPWDLASNLQGMRLVVRTGDGQPSPQGPGDPVEVVMHEMNERLHARLSDLGTAHDYHVTPGGTHTWDVWQAYFHATLPDLLDALAAPAPSPAAFRYRSAQRAFDVFDWRFRIDGEALAWTELEDVSATGLSASGTGTMTVTTAALYDPSRDYTVAGEHVVADAQGRLTFSVELAAEPTDVTITPAAEPTPGDPGGPPPRADLPATGGGALAGALLLALGWVSGRSSLRAWRSRRHAGEGAAVDTATGAEQGGLALHPVPAGATNLDDAVAPRATIRTRSRITLPDGSIAAGPGTEAPGLTLDAPVPPGTRHEPPAGRLRRAGPWRE